jgi:quinol monooxygenase YgiN
MLIVHVFVHVKPDAVDAFAAASRENARNSVREPGVIRFDVVQQEDDPTRFVLMEIYRTAEDRPGTRRPRTTPRGATRSSP